MTRVAFWYDRPQAYSGGLNYVRNLLYAMAQVGAADVVPFIFFGRKVDEVIAQGFDAHATVVRTSILDRKSIAWFAHQVLYRIFGSPWLVRRLLRRHRIDVVSHAEHLHGLGPPFRMISWIPDFQYLHLPELFPGLDAAAETRRLRAIVAGTDAVVLSSHAAHADFVRIAMPDSLDRARVLPFVSQPDVRLTAGATPAATASLEARYDFHGPFFFLPNQFWQHKNHEVVFEAVRSLCARGIDVLILCTGNLRDYRLKDNGYAEGLVAFVRDHGLGSNIRILGLIDYADVLRLMMQCIAVINPSRFEGWSSTVEEAKSIGKSLVLSDIPVHVEQDPPCGRFFAPDDPAALAAILAELWQAVAAGDPAHDAAQENVERDLRNRTVAFGTAYIDLLHQVAGASKQRHSTTPRPSQR